MTLILSAKPIIMHEPEFHLNAQNQGAFVIKDNEKQLAEMVFDIADSNMTVYHTEVAPEAEGQGLAKKLLDAMVAYVRANNLRVIPLCPFVHLQFKRHPAEFEDIWNKADNG